MQAIPSLSSHFEQDSAKLLELLNPGSHNPVFHSPRLPERSNFSRAIAGAVAEPDSLLLEVFR